MRRKLQATVYAVTIIGCALYLLWPTPEVETSSPGPSACLPSPSDPAPLSSECDEFCWTLGALDELQESLRILNEDLDDLLEQIEEN